jgi:hypothetical protein
MSTGDFLKAALEKKKAQQELNNPTKKSKGENKVAGGNQVVVNKPAKKSAGRGR